MGLVELGKEQILYVAIEIHLARRIGILGLYTFPGCIVVIWIILPVPDVTVQTCREETEYAIGLEPLLLLLCEGLVALA